MHIRSMSLTIDEAIPGSRYAEAGDDHALGYFHKLENLDSDLSRKLIETGTIRRAQEEEIRR